MSSTITPKPESSSAKKRQVRMVRSEPDARGTSTSGTGNSTQPRMKAGPIPIRRLIAPVASEPSTPPIEAAPSTRPSTPGVTPSVFVANRMNSAQKTKLKKLIVAVASSEARMIGEPHM
jgi:hypothetical protein